METETRTLRKIDINAKLQYIISRMGILLDEAKIKHPKKDFTDQKRNLEWMNDFQFEFLETEEESRTIRKLYFEVVSLNINLKRQNDEFTEQWNKLKAENEELKQHAQI